VGSIEFVVIVFGWAFLFYLNNRTLRRSEISRLKDRLVERVEAIRSWYVDEIRLDVDGKCRMSLEQNLAAQITQIELRMKQLNFYIGCEVVDFEDLASIREIDNDIDRSTQDIVESVHYEFSNLIENIEISYDSYFGVQSFLRRMWLSRKYEISGGVMGLIMLSCLFYVFSFFG
jgi:hypothetical protein